MEEMMGLQELEESISFSLGSFASLVEKGLADVREQRIVSRIWTLDHTVWKSEPTEITNRLGWLHSPQKFAEQIPRLDLFAEEVRAEGYTHAVVLGMGGSSLAPDMFGKTFDVRAGCLDVGVLDSTVPGVVVRLAEQLGDAHNTLFIVSTKSGTTVETVSLFKYFFSRANAALGAFEAGRHFVAITDPDSPLVSLSTRYGFREVFLNDPNIGGRYSALSYFGLVPAVLQGIDVKLLLTRAATMMALCTPGRGPSDIHTLGARLGVVLGELAKAGRDKVTFVCSSGVRSFGDWAEQLIAESTGKEGGGIVPVVGEPLRAPERYGDDRLFVNFCLEGDLEHDDALRRLENAGHPVVRINLRDLYDVGAQFALWEMAVAIAGHRLGINPFDQPNVEAAKILAREAVAAYKKDGVLPTQPPAASVEDIDMYGENTGRSPQEAIANLISGACPGAYIALQAYVEPNDVTDAALQHLRAILGERYRLATTVGYGPRFLHSTGQLHKGDSGNGLFIQITADDVCDIAIPDDADSMESSMTFGVLKTAQAMGDRQALLGAGRKVLRLHLRGDVAAGLIRIAENTA
jgi:glucose-6-phosphate isomerase